MSFFVVFLGGGFPSFCHRMGELMEWRLCLSNGRSGGKSGVGFATAHGFHGVPCTSPKDKRKGFCL